MHEVIAQRRGKAWLLVTMLSVMTLGLVGCQGTPSARVTTHGASATATSHPALGWRTVTMPSSVILASEAHQQDGAALAVSPMDGQDAWLCVPASAGSFAIWATYDAGVSWRQVGSFTPRTPLPTTCALQPDQLDSSTLAAGLSWGAGADGSLRNASWLSTDSGATWHAVPGEYAASDIATRAGVTYAILEDSNPFGQSEPPGIAISTDGLRTWRIVRPDGSAPGHIIFQVWLNPTMPELLAASEDNSLWHSSDGGARWTRVSAPDTQITLGAWIATQHHWLLCGGNPVSQGQMLCSTDLGANWIPRPVLLDTYTCSNCGKWGAPSGGTQGCGSISIAPDGALLAVCPPNGSVPSPTNFTLYRLGPGSSTWTTLGAIPSCGLTVPVVGPLWCWNAQTGTEYTATLPTL